MQRIKSIRNNEIQVRQPFQFSDLESMQSQLAFESQGEMLPNINSKQAYVNTHRGHLDGLGSEVL